jgi:hypothetical protein
VKPAWGDILHFSLMCFRNRNQRALAFL